MMFGQMRIDLTTGFRADQLWSIRNYVKCSQFVIQPQTKNPLKMPTAYVGET